MPILPMTSTNYEEYKVVLVHMIAGTGMPISPRVKLWQIRLETIRAVLGNLLGIIVHPVSSDVEKLLTRVRYSTRETEHMLIVSYNLVFYSKHFQLFKGKNNFFSYMLHICSYMEAFKIEKKM